jgi:hypothetical protein
MPKIPDFTSMGAAPVPVASRAVTQIDVTSGHEGDIARAKESMGRTIANIGGVVAEVQSRNDNIAVEDAWNKLQMKAQELENDQNTGFKRVKGADATDESFTASNLDRYAQATDEFMTGLKNDSQRELFRRRAEITKKSYSAALINHQASEADRYASGVEETTLKVGTSNIMQNPFDGVSVEAALVRSKATIEARGKRLGHSPEQIKQNTKDYYESNVASLISTVGDTSIDTAKAYMKRYDEYLGKDTKNKLLKQLDKANIINESQAKTDTIRAKYDDPKDQIAAARKLQGKERDEVIKRINSANELDRKIEKQAQADAGEKGLSLLNNGMPVPASVYAEMDPKTELAVRQREISGVPPTRDNLEAVDALNNFSSNDMMETDLNQYSHLLTDSTLKKYKREQQDLKEGKGTGSTLRQRTTQAVKTLYGKEAAPDEYARVQTMVDEWRAEQSPPPTWKQTQEFIDGLQTEVLTGGEIFGGAFGLNKEAKGKIKVEGVPDSHIITIINRLEADGQEVSDENIKKLYDVGVSVGLF